MAALVGGKGCSALRLLHGLRCISPAIGRYRPMMSRAAERLEEAVSFKIFLSNKVSEKPGAILDLLKEFSDANLNLLHMGSKLNQYSFGEALFEIDCEGSLEDSNIQKCLEALRARSELKVEVVPPRQVPWFPMNLAELDKARTALDGGTALINDTHPGFHDLEYRKRRSQIVELAKAHRFGQPIPHVNYTEAEERTWRLVSERLERLHKQHACHDFLDAMAKFNRHGVLTNDHIPQLQEVSELLHAFTGFQIRPVSGLISSRDFLNALAFRVFWSTQYIRHESNPFYTPEPDICHELLGHVPLFACPDFADFSQTIGLASLGASDKQIDRLGSVYWFTVEFGVLQTPSAIKAYGAGILSSFGELEWACARTPSDDCRASGGLMNYDAFKDLENPVIRPFIAEEAADEPYPITTYQPQYFASPSLAAAKDEVVRFCDSISKPFFCRYDPFSQRIKVTRSIKRMPPTTMAAMQAAKQLSYFENLKARGGGRFDPQLSTITL